MSYYYKNITDEEPVKVTVIQYSDKGRRVEIIRDTRIKGRTNFAGFWVNTIELIEIDDPL
jgi:hypothetical protein